jgi:hypothetical protein
MLYILTIDQIKDLLGIQDGKDDSLLVAWAEGLQGRFDSHLRRGLLFTESETEIFDGGESALNLLRYPVTSVASVHVDEDGLWSGDTLLDGGYLVNVKRGRLLYATGAYAWPFFPQSIRVVYSGGMITSAGAAAQYVADAELQTVRAAFRLQLNYEWRNRKTLGLGTVSNQGASVQNMVTIMVSSLLPQVEAMLHPLARIL